MTFTIMARCRESGQAGIALATVSLAAGGLVGFYTPSGDIVASQAYARARLGHDINRKIIAGATGEAAFAETWSADPHIGYRQVMILAGNVLPGPHEIEAMRGAYLAAARESVAERLMRGLEAGRDAGGQATGDGAGLAERSAMIRVQGAGEDAGFPVLDLRVDVHLSAVHELRRVHTMHAVYADYAARRDADAPNTPSIVAFEADRLKAGGVFAERPSCFR